MRRQWVRQGLDRPGSAERTVLLLRYETGLTLVEIAHIKCVRHEARQ